MRFTKKLLTAVLVLTLALVSIPHVVFANDSITVTIDRQTVAFTDQEPVIIDGRILVPVGGVFGALNFVPAWDGVTQTATLTRNDFTVVITIGSITFSTNGVEHTLDVPAQIINGRTMLPIRSVLESVGYELNWNGTTRTVVITSPIVEAPPAPSLATPPDHAPPIEEPTVASPQQPTPPVAQATGLNAVLEWNRAIFEQNPTDEESLRQLTLPSPGIESDHRDIVRMAQQITRGLTNDMDKAYAIHKWIYPNIRYDVSQIGYDIYFMYSGRGSAIFTLQNRRGICTGMARLTTALLRAADIPSKIVTGCSVNCYAGHMWTEAFVDGRWIIIDSGWDFDVSLRELSARFMISVANRSTLTEAVFLRGSTVINDRMFVHSYLTSIIVPSNITHIGEMAFAWSKYLEEVVLPDGLTTIRQFTFWETPSLTTLFIPPSVTYISNYTFNFNLALNLTIYGEAGSYAERFARRNGIPFVVATRYEMIAA